MVLIDSYTVNEEKIKIFEEKIKIFSAIETPIWSLDNKLLSVNDKKISIEITFHGPLNLDLQKSRKYKLHMGLNNILNNKLEYSLGICAFLIKYEFIDGKNVVLFLGFLD